MLTIFSLGYLVSAAFLCWERRELRRDFSIHNLLAIAFYIKIVFVVLEIAMGAAFIVCFKRFDGPAAVLEWAIAFFFILYASAFFIDLLPAVNRINKKGNAIKQEAEEGGAPEIE
jgi:fumarate reductase subunit C